MASGNVGEVLKTIPGIAVAPGGLGAPYTISLNGVPSNYVPVMINGISVADSAQGTGRTSGIHQLSINNMARIEVSYTPTSFEGSGSVEITPKARSQAQKGMSVLSGKRLGDC